MIKRSRKRINITLNTKLSSELDKDEVMFLQELFSNQVIVSVVVAFVICQTWKLIDHSIRKKHFDWGAIVATGGMPSSHSTFVCALAVSVGLVEGFLSSLFFVAAGLAMIVVRDAFGVRRTVDTVSKAVNEIIRKRKMGVDEIMKIAGHTPVQVAVGVGIGVFIPLAMHLIFYRVV